jgi:hypothetical protein
MLILYQSIERSRETPSLAIDKAPRDHGAMM